MMRFEKAGREQMEELVKTRIQVLRAANQLSAAADMGQTEQESRSYYEGIYHEHVYRPGVQEKRHCHEDIGFAGAGGQGTGHSFYCTGGHQHGAASV